MVDQLVLGLERPALALAPVPKARVGRALGPTDMLDRYVRHDVLHGTEHLATRAHRRPGLIDPQARHVLERGGDHRAVSHVPVKRATWVTATAAVRILSAVIVVPVHRRRRLQRRLVRRLVRRRRVRLSVVQLQVVVHGPRVQAAHVMISAVLVMVVMVVMPVVVVVGHVTADVQKVSRSRVARMMRRWWRRWRRRWWRRCLLLPVMHLMIVVLRGGHVVFLDLDAHAVDQRRVFHKRV